MKILKDSFLKGVNLYKADLTGADLERTYLMNAKLRNAKMRKANFKDADLRYADLAGADISGTIFINANMYGANLSGSNLSEANFKFANLTKAYLENSDITGTVLHMTILRNADFSGAKGFLCASTYLNEHFEKTDQGYIVYKTFGGFSDMPENWNIEPGAIIEEAVNPDRTAKTGCGISVCTYDRVNQFPDGNVYKLLIRWEWLADVVVPFNARGKIRCGKAEIIGPA